MTSNDTNSTNREEFNYKSAPLFYIKIFTICLGVVGNASYLISYYYVNPSKIQNNLYGPILSKWKFCLAILSIIDLIQCNMLLFNTLRFTTVQYHKTLFKSYGYYVFSCHIYYPNFRMLQGFSHHLYFWIELDRLIVIKLPFKYSHIMTKPKIYLMITTSTVLCFLVRLKYWTLMKIVKSTFEGSDWLLAKTYKRPFTCDLSKPYIGRGLLNILQLFVYVIFPLTSTFIVNVLLIKSLHMHLIRLFPQFHPNKKVPIRSTVQRSRSKRVSKAKKTLLIMNINFFLITTIHIVMMVLHVTKSLNQTWYLNDMDSFIDILNLSSRVYLLYLFNILPKYLY